MPLQAREESFYLGPRHFLARFWNFISCLPHQWRFGARPRCVRHAAMQMFSRRRYCRLRAWKTGVDESVFSSTTWRTCPTRTTIRGRTWRAVQDYRTSLSDCRSTNLAPGVVGKWTVTIFFTWLHAHIRLGTGGAAAVAGSARRTTQSG
eukprot:1584823-Amphidinium_carterae.1